jgi:hypothetical protein
MEKYPHKPHSKEWEADAFSILRGYAPSIYPCKKCGGPVVSGYCCGWCGDSSPSMTFEEEESFDSKGSK